MTNELEDMFGTIPTKDELKKLRDKFANGIIPSYADHPYTFIEKYFLEIIQDLPDLIEEYEEAVVTDLVVFRNITNGLYSTELPGVLAQFPDEESVDETLEAVILVAAHTGNPTATELTAKVHLNYDAERAEKLPDFDDPLNENETPKDFIDRYITACEQYLEES